MKNLNNLTEKKMNEEDDDKSSKSIQKNIKKENQLKKR